MGMHAAARLHAIHSRPNEAIDFESASTSIVLQNSKIAGLQIFMKNLKREAIADSFNLNRATEVADEFNAGR
jgi:hypothetical protein